MGTHSHSADDLPLAGRDSRHAFALALLLTSLFALVELIGGLWANSLALIGDAGHMVTDSVALALGAVTATIARKGATNQYSYGLQRAEVIGAMVNVLFMFGVVILIAQEAIERLRNPQPVTGLTVIAIASIGLVINLGVYRILHSGETTLNTRGALLHVLGDIFGSVAAIISGVVIWASGWSLIDPILSLLICLLILLSSTRILLESLEVVMEAVPRGIDLGHVRRAMIDSSEHVTDVHDVHVWTLSSRMTAMSAHVAIDTMNCWPELSEKLHTLLDEEFDIQHPTLQPEIAHDHASENEHKGP